MVNRRQFFKRAATAGLVAASRVPTLSAAQDPSENWDAPDGPDPIFQKPALLALAALSGQPAQGVIAADVHDYAPAHFAGALSPSPPHADMNPRRAVLVCWRGDPCRLVFSHEASYFPILELPNGTSMCHQFFVGNADEAELFNKMGRRERNSFVDVIQAGPERVWVRWTYFAVTKQSDDAPRFRGTEDYISYPNGLILRRMTYSSLMPESVFGYGNGAGMTFGVLPAKVPFGECFLRDAERGDYNVQTVLDLYSDRRHDIFFDERGGARRTGDRDTMEALSNSQGCAFVTPFRDRLLFVVQGTASGFLPDHNQYVDIALDPTFDPRYGGPNGYALYDHWPIGWLNSQDHTAQPQSPYPRIFVGGIVQSFVPVGKRLKLIKRDGDEFEGDMANNRWIGKSIFYSLIGSATDWSEVRRIGRAWLDKGKACARARSIANLR